MNEPLISVIVPVYKVEQYLEKCVDSICNQTYQNLEILLVDDGSPDRCGQICDTLAAQDSRIKVIHKTNGGLSSARNAGLDVMQGEYVGFVDSDDWVEPEMYATLLELIQIHNAKIAIGGISCDHPDGRCVFYNPAYPTESEISVFTVEEALRELTRHIKITNSVCDKLFHRSVFATCRMTEGQINEDFEIMPGCLEQSPVIPYTPRPMYHYQMTASSITRGGFRPNHFTESRLSRKRMAYYQEKYPDIYPYAVAGHADICLNVVDLSTGIAECAEERKLLMKELRTLVKPTVFRYLSRNNKIKYILFRISPKLLVWFMNRYRKSK